MSVIMVYISFPTHCGPSGGTPGGDCIIRAGHSTLRFLTFENGHHFRLEQKENLSLCFTKSWKGHWSFFISTEKIPTLRKHWWVQAANDVPTFFQFSHLEKEMSHCIAKWRSVQLTSSVIRHHSSQTNKHASTHAHTKGSKRDLVYETTNNSKEHWTSGLF